MSPIWQAYAQGLLHITIHQPPLTTCKAVALVPPTRVHSGPTSPTTNHHSPHVQACEPGSQGPDAAGSVAPTSMLMPHSLMNLKIQAVSYQDSNSVQKRSCLGFCPQPLSSGLKTHL